MGEGYPASVLDLTQTVCVGCHRLIHDKYLLSVIDGLWHEQCVRCVACGDPLKNTCFLRDQKLYCKRDYANLFAVRCGGCAEAISPAELVMHAGAAVFHLACFSCSLCSCLLRTGDCCVLREGRLLCARDYNQEVDRPTSSDSGESDDEEEEEEEEEKGDEGSVKASGRHGGEADDPEHKRPKRPRTILTTHQRRAFKASFEVSSKPCRKVRETLAAETGLSVRVVQVWFQNQRAKMKKLARRQQQQQQQEQQEQPAHHTVPSCGGLTSDLNPLSLYPHPQHHHPSLQQMQALAQATSLGVQEYDMEPFRQGLTPPQMPGDHMHPYGCKALYVEMDGNPLCNLGDGDCLSLCDSSLATPIDHLYSMQDSYFT
ncbi:LIM homeobox transcription factor 1-alpha [Oncorhynchus tshawytscha]|uniref:Uncharacterized protein n=1 Tax=Oncorhynchus tshawytscha TaxID=74940 RepID=A0AAZ3PZ56_ONCTS|nr:LIM homeobox transcription factor 1-alpha [Oncorhynchus tshawytscha]